MEEGVGLEEKAGTGAGAKRLTKTPRMSGGFLSGQLLSEDLSAPTREVPRLPVGGVLVVLLPVVVVRHTVGTLHLFNRRLEKFDALSLLLAELCIAVTNLAYPRFN